jgi:hypothetical protein
LDCRSDQSLAKEVLVFLNPAVCRPDLFHSMLELA